MAQNNSEESRLQALPHDLLGEILARVGASSASDFANAVMTCKDVHASAANPNVYKSLDLTPFVKEPLTAYDHMAMIQQCIASNNPEAHFIQGLLSYFVAEDRVDGLDHLLQAAEAGHTQAVYLYGILKLCIGHFDEGKAMLSKIKLVNGYKTLDGCWEELSDTLHGLPFATRAIYHTSLQELEPPQSCHMNNLRNKCDLCVYYKQAKKFIFML